MQYWETLYGYTSYHHNNPACSYLLHPLHPFDHTAILAQEMPLFSARIVALASAQNLCSPQPLITKYLHNMPAVKMQQAYCKTPL